MESARQACLELFSNELKIPNPYDDIHEQFEMFLKSIQNSIELCSSVKQCKQKKRKPLCFNFKVKKAISKKRQALKRFKDKPTASNETRLLKIGQKTSYTVKRDKLFIFTRLFKLYE